MFRKLYCVVILGWCIFMWPTLVWASSSGAKGGLMDPQPGLAFWTIITFICLLLLLTKLAWKPMIEALEKREEDIRSTIENAENSQKEAHSVLEEARKKLADSGIEARSILESAQKKASEIHKEMLGQAQQECTRLREQTQGQIIRAKEKAMEELWGLLVSVSTDVASRLMHKTLDSQEHAQLIANALQDIRKQREK